MAHVITRIGPTDLAAMRRMNALFAEAFEDAETYLGAAPDDSYLRDWLGKPHVIALAAFDGDALIGGLVAYVLEKFEQARSEVYIYDLAVRETHRREGVATALIAALKPIAQTAGAQVIFVQADYVDPPAIALYEKLGAREDVLHFDIPVLDE
ncbi:AAC(3)-I family aminoglycoside N-acetyltransferase [Roseinatronobacter alkalisoli]|uniref:AAC(3)-I family aminoglycoside N-acetyltransferase n=1 Tax=Roseinatronobacter alkalisoli TaxID=3028235 RepID=A0ABT5TCP1_9RHOB|nr:AAC(3)-I family aminoglycoside N-acetyltransferase [Roseinatronobacter sp. HJB301]MDD7972470.1 AAC(3)-I family aminoglycoside N-acetyltransferase [Roseinatronobacter sp. HJB301]